MYVFSIQTILLQKVIANASATLHVLHLTKTGGGGRGSDIAVFGHTLTCIQTQIANFESNIVDVLRNLNVKGTCEVRSAFRYVSIVYWLLLDDEVKKGSNSKTDEILLGSLGWPSEYLL